MIAFFTVHLTVDYTDPILELQVAKPTKNMLYLIVLPTWIELSRVQFKVIPHCLKNVPQNKLPCCVYSESCISKPLKADKQSYYYRRMIFIYRESLNGQQVYYASFWIGYVMTRWLWVFFSSSWLTKAIYIDVISKNPINFAKQCTLKMNPGCVSLCRASVRFSTRGTVDKISSISLIASFLCLSSFVPSPSLKSSLLILNG